MAASRAASSPSETGATIDVRAGAKGAAGSVLLRAPRTPAGVQATLDGQVLSERHAGDAPTQVSIEGNRVYDVSGSGTTLAPELIKQFATDNQSYMSGLAANAVGASLRGDGGTAQGNVQVRPAVEVRTTGDLTISSNWNLTTPGWLTHADGSATMQAGSLAVRAAGNVTLDSASLGNPDTSLQPTPTWNIAVTSGADLSAANPFALQTMTSLGAQVASGRAGAGDLLLDSSRSEASIRTGTGNIHLAAGRDFIISGSTDPNSQGPLVGVVYTSGIAALPDPRTAAKDSRFVQHGGNVTIVAGRDATGAANEWMTEWFRSATQADGGLSKGAWWAYRPNFHDGVAALGGGDVSITAGGSVSQLSAWVPTSAIQSGTASTSPLNVFGGGNLSVRAGNDIVGGQYMTSLGALSLSAGGSVGTAAAPSQVLMMGMSGDPAQPASTVTVTAGRSVDLSTIDNPSSLYQTQTSGRIPQLQLRQRTGDPQLYSRRRGNPGREERRYRPWQPATRQPDSQHGRPVDGRRQDLERGRCRHSSGTSRNGSLRRQHRLCGNVGGLTLFPSSSGAVQLLAGRNIDGMNVTVSDANPALVAVSRLPRMSRRSTATC